MALVEFVANQKRFEMRTFVFRAFSLESSFGHWFAADYGRVTCFTQMLFKDFGRFLSVTA